MLIGLRQMAVVTRQSLMTLPNRLGDAWATLVGIAGVVVVFVGILAVAVGFEKTLNATAGENNVLILRSGSGSEMDSGLSGEQTDIITRAPGFARNQRGALVSEELYVVVDLDKKSTGSSANVPLRGVGQAAMDIRDNFKIEQGRHFSTGRKELIAGIAAVNEFSGLNIGSTLEFGQERWRVVGIFSANGGVAESELWADAPIVQSTYRRGNSYSAVYGKLSSGDALDTLRDSIRGDPRLSVDVHREADYYADQSRALVSFVTAVGTTITLLMAIAAVLGSVNTMYTAVVKRAREIATLRVLGFNHWSIIISVLSEAIVLALLGGIIGGMIAYLLFNGTTVSTLNFSSFSQVVFSFSVTPALVFKGILIAMAIGIVGGLLPAIRATRLSVVEALKVR